MLGPRARLAGRSATNSGTRPAAREATPRSRRHRKLAHLAVKMAA